MKKELYKQYAKLIVRVGVNLQKGQGAVVNAPLSQQKLVHQVVKECYKAGAAWVQMEWEDQKVQKLAILNEKPEMLGKVWKWQEEKMKSYVEELPARIYIISDDPEGLLGIDQMKLQQAQVARHKILKKYRDAMETHYQWVIAAGASKEWAVKVFPDEKPKDAVEHLWAEILKTVHLTEDNDPVKVWKKRGTYFEEKCRKLNDCHLKELHYESSNGTDLTVGMIPGAEWHGGGDTTPLSAPALPWERKDDKKKAASGKAAKAGYGGVLYIPNLPTEEVFISPKAGKADGRVVATRPLSFRGELIENFSLTFADGKVVSCEAKKGEDALKALISADEGSAMLGETALVPKESPVGASGLFFYSTLFDENACCHLALGSGFPEVLKGFEKMTPDDWKKNGINASSLHTDFMIGSDDMKITGITKDGKKIVIFENGTWAV